MGPALSREPLLKTIDLIVLTSFVMGNIVHFCTTQVALMRRSTVLSQHIVSVPWNILAKQYEDPGLLCSKP
jgi:hypothetical protein